MQYQSLYFAAPYQVELREATFPPPQPRELVVKSLYSAISAGTEMLLYRGQAPQEMLMDESIPSLNGKLVYPFQYGYAMVGRVEEVGRDVDRKQIGQLVFSFQPHQTHFKISADQAMILPSGLNPRAAIFLPNMETAVNFLMDGHPLIGERVVVFGQGIVGLLTTSLLTRFPLETLFALDIYPNRRTAALEAGADQVLDPTQPETLTKIRGERGVDLAFEVSGSPAALDQAIAVTGFDGRVVIGSWYGKKRVNLDLGGDFHRSRI